MSKSPEFIKIRKQRMDECGACELCGRRYGLELHHIVPVAFGGEDTNENLILLCSPCHARLTPKSVLAKAGMQKFHVYNYFEYVLGKIYYTSFINDDRTALNVFDSIEQVFGEEKEKYKQFSKTHSHTQFFSALKNVRKEEIEQWQALTK